MHISLKEVNVLSYKIMNQSLQDFGIDLLIQAEVVITNDAEFSFVFLNIDPTLKMRTSGLL